MVWELGTAVGTALVAKWTLERDVELVNSWIIGRRIVSWGKCWPLGSDGNRGGNCVKNLKSWIKEQ